MPNCCIVYGSSKSKDSSISLYCFPKQPELRKKWLDGLHLTPDDVDCESRGCSKHFRDGSRQTVSSYQIGTRFAEHPSMETSRRKRWASRELQQKEPKCPCIRSSLLSQLPLFPPTLSSTPLATLPVPPTSYPSTPTPSSTCTPRSSTTPDPLVVSPVKASVPRHKLPKVISCHNFRLDWRINAVSALNCSASAALNTNMLYVPAAKTEG